MKKIDFKNPKYVLPLICLPFILLLFYVYRLSSKPASEPLTENNELKSEISSASSQVTGKGIEDKLEAFKERYKKSDGYTALGAIDVPIESAEENSSAYNLKEKQMLDSIGRAIKSAGNNAASQVNTPVNTYSKYAYAGPPSQSRIEDKNLNELLSKYTAQNRKGPEKQTDPMAIFRAQMAIVDSMNKSAVSPKYAANQHPSIRTDVSEKPQIPAPLKVMASDYLTADSSTIIAGRKQKAFIQGVIDKTLTGYDGSRVSMRLLSEVKVGGMVLERGSLLYALITGFSSQRVLLSISSIAINGEILPVNLEIYDLDGLKGIYVPSSSYREFSRELASNVVGGVSLESSSQNQQLTSLLGRMFQSTSGAVNKFIRSNKAKISYPSKVYLLDKSFNKTSSSL